EAQRVQGQPVELVRERLAVEDPENRVLAVDARHHRDAEVDLATSLPAIAVARLEAAVLRHAALGDVELRHHLDARDHLLGELASRHVLHAGQHAVDAVLDGEPGAGGLEVHVARARLQRVVERRGHQAHHGAVGLRRRLEGDFLRSIVFVLTGMKIFRNAVKRAQLRSLLREVGGDVGGLRHAIAEGLAQPLLDPVLRVEVVGVAQHHEQRAVARAQRDATAARRLGEGDRVEVGPLRAHFGERDGGDAQRLGELLEVVAHLICPAALMPPASSKIGMYIRTTTAPTDRPRTAISSGSKARVNQSMKRATSSSWKRAIWRNISPMSPLLSPTLIMRAATGVASPAAPMAADIGWPCSIMAFARVRLGRTCAASSWRTMSSARTAGIPALSSMPAVRYSRASW